MYVVQRLIMHGARSFMFHKFFALETSETITMPSLWISDFFYLAMSIGFTGF